MNKFQVNMIHYNHYHKFPQVSPVRKPVVNATAPNLSQVPPIKLPFPPTIRASDIARKRLRSRICSKSPNAFFVYRKAFVDQLSVFGENKKLKMTEVSRLVSSRWKMESKQVKAAYEEIAKQVEKELNDIRNKDLVYTDDFGIGGGRRKAKNRKRGRRSNSEFGTDAFFLNLKGGNFNISTLDFSVKPDDDNDKNHENDNSDNTDSNSSLSETSIVECKESEENSSSDESSIDNNNNYISHLDSITVTINNDHNNHDNDSNDDNHNSHNIQPFQQNQFDLGELTSQYYSEVGMELNCNLNLLTPIPPLVCDDELISFYQQNGFYPNEDPLNCYMDNFDLS